MAKPRLLPLANVAAGAALALGLCSSAAAQRPQLDCWEPAAERYGLDPDLLRAIAWQESRGHLRAIGPRLPDGNRAIGLMQINTIHMPRLAARGLTEEHLLSGCPAVYVGAEILADCIAKKGATWAAVGCYYAGPGSRAYGKQAGYVADVMAHFAGYKAARAGRAATVVASAGVRSLLTIVDTAQGWTTGTYAPVMPSLGATVPAEGPVPALIAAGQPQEAR